MSDAKIAALLPGLTTPHLADACIRKGVEVRCAPPELVPLDRARSRFVGRARPVRHYGSVDVFFEAIADAEPGDVLVIDNQGRTDEACVGDLVALEAKAAGIAGLIVGGLHRDTAELLEIGLPLFSAGALPTGPQSLRPRENDAFATARVGRWWISRDDVVVADLDGVLFLPVIRVAELADTAQRIRDTEREQAARVGGGTSLREQLRFAEYLAARVADPATTFRQHLRRFGGAVEE